MDDAGFFRWAARYKFTLAMENYVCDDYVTEKLWRPLRLGSVPIVFGAPNIKVIKYIDGTVHFMEWSLGEELWNGVLEWRQILEWQKILITLADSVYLTFLNIWTT